MGLFSKLLSDGISITMPQFALPAKIISVITSWRPSVSDIGIMLLLIVCGVQTARIEGIHIKPHVAFIHFTLVDVTGFKDEVSSLKAEINSRIASENAARIDQAVENTKGYNVSAISAAQTNTNDTLATEKVNEAVDAYIRSHPVSKCSSVQTTNATSDNNGATSVSSTISVTPSGQSSNLDPQMVAVPVDEFHHYTTNTQDLIELRAFLANLVANKWAITWEQYQAINAASATSK